MMKAVKTKVIFIIAAEFATQENINFMVKYARGIVCTPMRREALECLGIPAMVTKNTDNHEQPLLLP